MAEGIPGIPGEITLPQAPSPIPAWEGEHLRPGSA